MLFIRKQDKHTGRFSSFCNSTSSLVLPQGWLYKLNYFYGTQSSQNVGCSGGRCPFMYWNRQHFNALAVIASFTNTASYLLKKRRSSRVLPTSIRDSRLPNCKHPLCTSGFEVAWGERFVRSDSSLGGLRSQNHLASNVGINWRNFRKYKIRSVHSLHWVALSSCDFTFDALALCSQIRCWIDNTSGCYSARRCLIYESDKAEFME